MIEFLVVVSFNNNNKICCWVLCIASLRSHVTAAHSLKNISTWKIFHCESHELGGERFISSSWLEGGGRDRSGVFQEGGRGPPGKGAEGSSKGGPPGCPTGSYWLFSSLVINRSSSSPKSPPINEGSPTIITSWHKQNIFQISECKYFYVNSSGKKLLSGSTSWSLHRKVMFIKSNKFASFEYFWITFGSA